MAAACVSVSVLRVPSSLASRTAVSFSSPAQASFVPGHNSAISLRSAAPKRAAVRMDAGNKGSTGSTLVGEGTAPLSGTTTPAGIPQEGVPVAERIAYICQDCGYIYDQEKPFEELPDESYNCPVCTAPKARFIMQNTSVGEAKGANEDL